MNTGVPQKTANVKNCPPPAEHHGGETWHHLISKGQVGNPDFHLCLAIRRCPSWAQQGHICGGLEDANLFPPWGEQGTPAHQEWPSGEPGPPSTPGHDKAIPLFPQEPGVRGGPLKQKL